MAAYGVSELGNFEGKNILRHSISDKMLAERFNLPEEAITEKLNAYEHACWKYAHTGCTPTPTTRCWYPGMG